MANFLLLIILLIGFLQQGFALDDHCFESINSNQFIKYKNQYADSFNFYFKDNQYLMKYDDHWFSNVLDVSKSCPELRVIKKPNRVILMSSTLLEVFRELGLEKSLIGLAEKKYIYQNTEKLEHVKDLGNVPLAENVLALSPDLILGYRSPALSSFYEKLNKLNIPIIYIDDFNHKHPLARAELRIVVGALVGRLQDTMKIFEKVSESYNRHKNSVVEKRRVLLGAQVNGAWKLIDQNTDFYQLVMDAGAIDVLSHYHFKNVSIEEILKLKDEIEHWLPQNNFQSLEEISRESNFLKVFLNMSHFKISTYGKKVNEFGGAEFWDVAMMRPDILIGDIINILGTSNSSNPLNTRWYKVLR